MFDHPTCSLKGEILIEMDHSHNVFAHYCCTNARSCRECRSSILLASEFEVSDGIIGHTYTSNLSRVKGCEENRK